MARARERPRPLGLRVNESEPLRAARGRRCTADQIYARRLRSFLGERWTRRRGAGKTAAIRMWNCARRRVDLDQVIALQVRTAPDRAIPTNVSGGCVSLSRRRPDVWTAPAPPANQGRDDWRAAGPQVHPVRRDTSAIPATARKDRAA